MNLELMDEVRRNLWRRAGAEAAKVAQQRIKASVMASAQDTHGEITRIGTEVAKQLNGLVSEGPTKSLERATEKVSNDYEGDWYSIKDVARITIIVPSQALCDIALRELQARFSASRGLGVIQTKIVDPNQDACGYSGSTVFVRASNGRFGEIQVNSPQMVYAKENPEKAKRVLGESAYMKIAMKYQLPGGLGHKLYEVYRVAPHSPRGASAAALSKSYYRYFRSDFIDPSATAALKKSITGFNLSHV